MNKVRQNSQKGSQMKKILCAVVPVLGVLTLSSCSMPGVVSNPNCASNCVFPQSVTETHTKTTLVAPPSYATPYLPPAAIYQTAPVQAPMPIAAPQCPQVIYQAPQPVYQAAPCQPVQYRADPCQPVQAYRADPCQPVQYQAYQDPCAPYQSGYLRNPYGYYTHPHSPSVAHPNPVPVQASPTTKHVASDHCED